MDQQPLLYPTDDSRVSFACSLLTGRALDWATAVWEGGNMAFPSFRNFMRQFREVFKHSVDGKEVGEQLLALQVGVTHLTSEERERRRHENLCLYCGLPDHMRISCPTRPTFRGSSLVSSNPSTLSTLEVPVTIMFDNSQFDSLGLIDSGAAGNFIDVTFAKAHSLPLVSCESGVAVAAQDGRPLVTSNSPPRTSH